MPNDSILTWKSWINLGMIKKEPFRVFFQQGVGVYAGPVLETKPHSHHATEIIVGLTGTFIMSDSRNAKKEYALSLIPHDIKHQFINPQQIIPVFIYLDPFHGLAQQLIQYFNLNNEIVNPDTLMDEAIKEKLRLWLVGEDLDILLLVHQLVNHLTGYSFNVTAKDSRIVKSLDLIRASISADLRLKDVASSANLSESRFAHLFKDQVGIPFRRFVLWTRLQTTVESILKGKSLTSACYDGGFADLSHFTKTFIAMFGVTPSSVLKG